MQHSEGRHELASGVTMAVLVMFVLTAPGTAVAHSTDGGKEAGWAFPLWLTLPMASAALVWGAGFRRRWRRTRAGRPLLSRGAFWFASAWVILALAVFSPLHEAGETSFTMHMIEHEIIMMLAAPLFALARPLPTMVWGLAQPWRRWVGAAAARTGALWRTISAPVFATIAQSAALWLWHVPSLFDVALRSGFWHAVQHISFFLTALLFWGAMLDKRHAIGLRAVCLFATSIVSGVLGALMTFSESPWYEPYAMLGMTPQGLTPAEDQQLGGILMWVPGGALHAGAALILLAPYLRADAILTRER